MQSAVSAFGAEVTPKLKGGGWQEDQLRGPLETLIRTVGRYLGFEITLTGEVPLVDLNARPDYAVSLDGALIGYIELKKPGTGADPESFTGRNAQQWEKLRLLPNVLYCDGDQFSTQRSGRQSGRIARMKGSVLTSGSRLEPADGDLARVLYEFLVWQPQAPRTTGQLVRAVAGLCRLLCDEVTEAMALERAGRRRKVFTEIAEEWRRLLFPETTDEEFVEQFGQSVVFALLLARVEGIAFEGETMHSIATKLGKKHSLMGKALDVLTEESSAVGLSTILDTLTRVIGAVDWTLLDDGSGDAYLLLYEDFLQIYDRDMRMRTGSYYTPHGIVEAMVRLTEGILQNAFGITNGLASREVVVVDPAMGTGTFLLSVLTRAAATIRRDEGPGAVGPQLRQMVGHRLVGFERQIGPFAVAELRMYALLKEFGSAAPAAGLRLLVADTLDNPRAEFDWIPHTYKPLAESRRKANCVKRDERVMVVIGNPPHDTVPRGAGKWVETGDPGTGVTAPLNDFRLPGNGTYESKLSNLYVHFWRWGTWKVFDAHEDAPFGVVAYLTPKAWLKGRAFAGMRRYLREVADEGWIIDLSPEGQRPDNATRLFPEVAQELCIAVFVRRRDSKPGAATVRYLQVHGHRDEKTNRLMTVELDDPEWRECASGSTDPFLPPGSDLWQSSPLLEDLMPWSSRGVTPGRVWIYAPDQATLRDRWHIFLAADSATRRSLLGEARDRTIDSQVTPLPGVTGYDRTPLRAEHREQSEPVQIGYRSFDRQWILPDHRLMVVGRPDLWRVRSDRQVFTVEQNAHRVVSGPGLVFSALIPDMHYYNGRSGCVRPLYRDAVGESPNIMPGLLELLAHRFGTPITPEDLLAYVAAVTSHPAYTSRFREDLAEPKARVPITADADVWSWAVLMGRRVLWLHTYGERFADPGAGRPRGVPSLPDSHRPRCAKEIPDTDEGMPETLGYDPAQQQLWIGTGCIAPVPANVRDYEVSGMNVLDKWFGYRRRKPAGKRRLDLDHLVATRWPPEWTTELLALLNVLGLLVQAETNQEQLLDAICAGPRIAVEELTLQKLLPVAPRTRRPLRLEDPAGGTQMFDL